MAFRIRRLAKQIVAFLIYYTGLFDLIRYVHGLKKRSVTIVTFHRVGGERCGESAYSLPNLFVSQESFEEMIGFFQRKFSPIPLSDLLRGRENPAKLPRNPLVITFDDGYEDNYTHAFPVLKKFRVPATFFLTSSFIDSDETFWWDRRFHALERRKPAKMRDGAREGGCPDETVEFSSSNRMLSWDQVREMKESGMTFGSHSRTHVNLNRVAKPRLTEEVLASKKEIERNLGEEVLFFAYPGGSHSEEVRDAVVESGYRCACSTEPGVNDAETSLFALKRINIWQGAVSGVKGGFSKPLLAMHLLRKGRKRSGIQR